jgi:ABC-type lipoprotein export system ATPase subunit
MAGARVTVKDVSRCFRLGAEEVWALRGVSLEVSPGEFLALIGRSGSGKTTLLNLIAGLDRPTTGDVIIDGRSVPAMREAELLELRRRTLGFVFQSFGLLPLLSAAENVELPLRIAGIGRAERVRRVRWALDTVGLGRRAHHRPYELSGGEQQRVAIARALAIQPRLILADEPTGELDSTTAVTIFTLLRDLARSEGITIITSTHDRLVMELAGRVEELSDGRLVQDGSVRRFVAERARFPGAALTHPSSRPAATPTLTPGPSPARGRGVPSDAVGGDSGRGEGSPGPGVRAAPVLAPESSLQHGHDEPARLSPAPSPPPGPASPDGAEGATSSPAPDEDILRWAPPDRRQGPPPA